MPHRLLALLLGAALLQLVVPALVAAEPVTVDLRIEGKTRTLYEGPVTTDVRTVDMGDGTGSHVCDGTDNPATPVPGPTRGAAFIAAATGPDGFTFKGAFRFDMQFTEIAGDPVALDPFTMQFLAEYKNGRFAAPGSCRDQIAGGDEVLYAYATRAEQLLKLSAGASRVAPGQPLTLTVTDPGTTLPVAGADVGGRTSGADGTVQLTFTDRGPVALKATKAGAVRSNRVAVCVTDGADGACGTSVAPLAAASTPAACATTGRDGLCGTPDRTAPGATVRGIADGQRFARGRGPRRLRALIDADPAGLAAVKLRLTRTDRGACTYFSGTYERFRRSARCGAAHGFWLDAGSTSAIDYLLPGPLPPGRYVFDVNAIDNAANRDDPRRRGANRVVFRVG
jgi:hypothetical protein